MNNPCGPLLGSLVPCVILLPDVGHEDEEDDDANDEHQALDDVERQAFATR